MNTNDTTITLNLYARNITEWKLFVVEQMMCSRFWPKDMKLLRPSLGTEEMWLRRAIAPETYPVTGKMVEIISKNGVLSLGNFKKLDGRGLAGSYVGVMWERWREYICSGGSVLTSIYQKPEESSSTQSTKDPLGWYETLKMLWKGNGIVPRWDGETCRRENGEREFMATMRDPPFVLQAPKKLDGWEKTRLDEGSWRWVVGVGTEVVGWAWGGVRSYLTAGDGDEVGGLLERRGSTWMGRERGFRAGD
ncbi:hypothetical protein HYALB_00002069 [Hymenoscyphus albidus]|uniref:Uncharacterized protein n=1 Tax=Hymenoscyphus albidus TaxID=595503 RepID=A0A9N9LE29_9HELO|nr:hypothetical protein HYALB_00002069 [Hymenoscyphus albidus]